MKKHAKASKQFSSVGKGREVVIFEWRKPAGKMNFRSVLNAQAYLLTARELISPIPKIVIPDLLGNLDSRFHGNDLWSRGIDVDLNGLFPKDLLKKFFNMPLRVVAAEAYIKLKPYRHAVFLLLFILLSLFLTTVVRGISTTSNTDQHVSAPVPTISPPTPTPTPYVGVPTRLVIPKLSIDTNVESVGYDENEKIGVPSNFTNVAWFTQSYKPGQLGNAFIDGHYDTYTGAPAVFYYLSSLAKGDTVTIYDDAGDTYTFVVTEVADFQLSDIPMQKMFTPIGKGQLYLLTCHGNFDRRMGTYDKRTIVTAQLTSSEKPTPVSSN